ncbi:helix-turn-helix domain-containing protein [Desulfovibrio inopinatus]|uniref:helix-turn-helix domain-containing protein n=1 Tax=Desulfovibrio inopinatus TaxID=102109 RepID=UPI000405004D|nr:helix-turn-helix transcriptional regulator [Desulfovibrio inopinatus]
MHNTMNVYAGRGPGRYRDTWAIRKSLDLAGVTMAEVGRRLGLTPQTVSDTVRGRKNSRQVLRYLLEELEISAEVLSLPDDMQVKEEA